jgi:PAS domain S-box-containing protein
MASKQPTRGDGCDGPLSAHERAQNSHQGTAEVPELSVQVPDKSGFDPEALDLLPCGYLIMTREGQVLWSNRCMGKILATVPGAIAGKNFSELLTRGSAIFYETHFLPSLLLRATLEEIAFDLLTADRAHQPVLVNAVVQPSRDGREQILMTVFGAKQRRLYEAEILRARREAEQVAEIVRRSSDAIIRISPEGMIESWNNGAHHIFGYTVDSCIGRPLDCLFAPESQDDLKLAVSKVRSGDDIGFDAKGLNASGHQVDVSVSLTPHMEAPGTLVAFSAIIRDITARKRGERALIQSEKLASVGRLASSIAHEINNPLEAVTNLLYILRSTVTEPHSKELVNTAQEELARVSHIATHTLRFHKQSSERTRVDLRAEIDSVLALYRARLSSAGVQTNVECPTGLMLTCYEGELRQILMNLISNAFDAMRSGGRLRVRAYRIRGRVQFRVLIGDTGTGLSPDVQAHLFEPFFSTKGIGGTGLGLWITKDLMAKNLGQIRIKSSVRPGRSGTLVILDFRDGG